MNQVPFTLFIKFEHDV